MTLESLSHPGRDMAMEMLCLLPRWPVSARIIDLMNDLGTPDVKEIMILIRHLDRRAVEVKKSGDGCNRRIAIAVSTWERAQDLGLKYLAEMELKAVATV